VNILTVITLFIQVKNICKAVNISKTEGAARIWSSTVM
jgi:nitrogen regulatory protein PII-like uncharacterized protein